MRECQMVTYPSLTRVPYPANALYFYGIIIGFANIDIAGSFLEKNVFSVMRFVATDALNAKFDSYGIGSLVFV